MAIGRALSILNLYDLLANLIPGMAWVIVLIVLFPVDLFGLSPTRTPGTFVAAVIIFGFIAGHIAQWAGSRLDRLEQKYRYDGEDLYARTMEAMENGEKSPIGGLTHVEESFEELAKDQFQLPAGFPNNYKLLLLVLSYLETRPATRASRFQAIHTFHRSMWAASIFTVVSSFIALVATETGLVTNHWATPVLTFVGSVAITVVFYKRKNKFEKTFLKYVFRDFYQDQVRKRKSRIP